jgi:hypothetical protein
MVLAASGSLSQDALQVPLPLGIHWADPFTRCSLRVSAQSPPISLASPVSTAIRALEKNVQFRCHA